MRTDATAPLPDAALVRVAAAGLILLAFASALLAPPVFWLLLTAGAALAVVFVAFRFTPALTAVWVVLTAASLEMTAADLLGPAAFQPVIAIAKGAGIGLAVVAALRYGVRLDAFSPAFAWLAMFPTGLAHGLWPGLTPIDSLRSLIGSLAPFAFGFCRPSRSWAVAVIRATARAPLLVTAAGGMLDLAGVRPLFVNSGGLRLAGLGHPAFLGAVCETAIYACLIEWFRAGRRTDAGLLATNVSLLLLTGARAPLALSAAVVGLSLALVPSPALPPGRRLLCILAAAATLPPVAALLPGPLPDDATAIRAVHLLTTDAANLSGRDLLWPDFAQATTSSPWFGWGVGAGNVIIPIDDPVARLLQTRAAHNEYLRVTVEGGEAGCALLVLLFVLWVRGHTARLHCSDRAIMRLVFLALAVHAFTDNMLISTPACVLFAFAAAVFARGEAEGGPSPPARPA